MSDHCEVPPQATEERPPSTKSAARSSGAVGNATAARPHLPARHIRRPSRERDRYARSKLQPIPLHTPRMLPGLKLRCVLSNFSKTTYWFLSFWSMSVKCYLQLDVQLRTCSLISCSSHH